MKVRVYQQVGCLFLLFVFLGTTLYFVLQFTKTNQSNGTTLKQSAIVSPTIQTASNQCHGKTVSYETGISSPQWSKNGYDPKTWGPEVLSLEKETDACWIGMPLLFHQTSYNTTDVQTGQATPTVQSFINGVRYVHAANLHVFATFLLGTGYTPDPWDGKITLPDPIDQQAWFGHYFTTIKPYLQAAQDNRVEQLAMGTEEKWLQNNAPDTLWIQLLQQIRSIYTGTLTYDANWDTLLTQPPSWMKSKYLSFIGISAYVPVINTSHRVNPNAIAELWRETVKTDLDTFSQEIGSPVLISEIGYRQASDALYNPWNVNITTSKDPQEQAAACSAAITNTIHDPSVRGIFFWGWGDGVGGMNLSGTLAAQTIQTSYQNV